MVDQKFRIDTEHPIQEVFIIKVILPPDGTACHIPHGVDAARLQFARITRADPPEVCQGSVIP